MITSTNSAHQKQQKISTAIVFAGLLVGTLDLTAAVIQTLLAGRDPMKMLQFISSGIFGMNAFKDALYSYTGILFHYCLAMGWTVIFFLIYPHISFFKRQRVLGGVLYGLLVWGIMNQVILPFSNTPALTFNFTGALVAAGILIVAIGLPLSFLAHRYFYKTK